MTFKFGGVVVRRSGKTLLVRERHARARNLWSFPLGFIEKGESVREAAVREAKEESGYDVRLVGSAGSIVVPAREFRSAHPFQRGEARLSVFYGRVGRKRPSGAALIARWFSDLEIASLTLRGEWEKKFLLRRRPRKR